MASKIMVRVIVLVASEALENILNTLCLAKLTLRWLGRKVLSVTNSKK